MLYTALPASAGCRKEVARLASHAPIVLTLKEAQDAYWQILQRNLPRIAIDTKPLLPILKSGQQIVWFESVEAYNKAAKDREFVRGEVLVIEDVQRGRRLAWYDFTPWIKKDQRPYRERSAPKLRMLQAEDAFFINDFGLYSREAPFEMGIRNQGGQLSFKDAAHYLIEQSPGDSIIFTRTMSEVEFKIWQHDPIGSITLGLDRHRQEIGTPYHHVSFSVGGYFSDGLPRWQREIDVRVSKDQLLSWYEQGQVYVCPFNIFAVKPLRYIFDTDFPVGFEVASVSQTVNRYLVEAYRYQLGQTDAKRAEYHKVLQETVRIREAHSDFKIR